jgi:prephenate dehydrogenase
VARLRWASRREPVGHRVRLDGPAALAALRKIGRRGDIVTGWTP